jgi:hypothetical protein
MNDQAERDLMTRIQKAYGPLLVSTETASSIPAAFFAALIANESGGNPNATRFEPAVFTALAEVLLGRKAAYGSLGAQDLSVWLVPKNLPDDGAPVASGVIILAGIKNLADLATSWGLTQIMGYEAIAYHLIDGVAALVSPVSGMARTAIMLKDFARRNGLSLTKDFPELFDCWNTGRPHAPTADATYIPDGLARMALYQSLESAT